MKKILGLNISEWILVFTLMLLEKFGLITFAESIIIVSIAVGLGHICMEVEKIKKYMESLK